MSQLWPTLVKPPAPDPNKSLIEQGLELTRLDPIDPDLFTNTRPLWHPPGARGLFGGSVIAQCLAVGYRTVPDNFDAHSMHCYFVLAGVADIPIIYHVERIRTGRSFATRTVQAKQQGKVIFTTTISFARTGAGGSEMIEHTTPMPFVPSPDDDRVKDILMMPKTPIVSRQIDIANNDSPYPHSKKTRQWIKAEGRISDEGSHQAHLAAVAYMSDQFFIGTVSRVHKLWRIPVARHEHKEVKVDEDVQKKLRSADMDSKPSKKPKPVVTMMVSLDHTIYFHDPRGFRADEWLFTEMESPWAGDGRGLVTQRIYTQSGKLVATCVQEGVVRLKQNGKESKL